MGKKPSVKADLAIYMIKYLVFLGSAWVQLSRTGKKRISVIVAIRPDPVTYASLLTKATYVRMYVGIVSGFIGMEIYANYHLGLSKLFVSST